MEFGGRREPKEGATIGRAFEMEICSCAGEPGASKGLKVSAGKSHKFREKR